MRNPIAALALLGATGCAMEPDVGDDEATEPSVSAAAQVGGAAPGVNVPNPEGSYFASVGALGTGCPKGTFKTVISNDGQTFTTTFSSYRVEFIPDSVSVTKDCQLFIRLHSPQGLSFAVTSFLYAGIGTLDPGVRATLRANYYFQGNPVPPSDRSRKELRGPYDGTFQFTDEIITGAQVWSPCGVERDLNVRTQLQISRGDDAVGDGSVQLAAIEGNTALKLKIAWRRCR